jgi:hypothetical protein
MTSNQAIDTRTDDTRTDDTRTDDTSAVRDLLQQVYVDDATVVMPGVFHPGAARALTGH